MIITWFLISALNLTAGFWNLRFDNPLNLVMGFLCCFIGGWFLGKILAYIIFPPYR